MPSLEAAAGTVSAFVAIAAAIAAAAWWLYRRGASGGTLRGDVRTATTALRQNTEETRQLREEFAAHRAATGTRLDEHQRILIQHDKRLSAAERRTPR